jgi:hypothetical protein
MRLLCRGSGASLLLRPHAAEPSGGGGVSSARWRPGSGRGPAPPRAPGRGGGQRGAQLAQSDAGWAVELLSVEIQP